MFNFWVVYYCIKNWCVYICSYFCCRQVPKKLRRILNLCTQDLYCARHTGKLWCATLPPPPPPPAFLVGTLNCLRWYCLCLSRFHKIQTKGSCYFVSFFFFHLQKRLHCGSYVLLHGNHSANEECFFQNSLSPLFGQIQLSTLYSCLQWVLPYKLCNLCKTHSPTHLHPQTHTHPHPNTAPPQTQWPQYKPH